MKTSIRMTIVQSQEDELILRCRDPNAPHIRELFALLGNAGQGIPARAEEKTVIVAPSEVLYAETVERRNFLYRRAQADPRRGVSAPEKTAYKRGDPSMQRPCRKDRLFSLPYRKLRKTVQRAPNNAILQSSSEVGAGTARFFAFLLLFSVRNRASPGITG